MQIHHAETERRRAERTASSERIAQKEVRAALRRRNHQQRQFTKLIPRQIDPSGIIRGLARQWFHDPERPRIAPEALKVWMGSIREFTSNNKYHLLLRRSGSARGKSIGHLSGRNVVFTDNSPAIWLFRKAAHGEQLQSDEIEQCLHDHTLPVALAFSRSEYESAAFKGVLTDYKNWQFQLCHYDDIGKPSLKWGAVSTLDLQKLIDRSRRFLLLNNMFVVRKDRHYTQGLGENSIFRDELRRLESANAGCVEIKSHQ